MTEQQHPPRRLSLGVKSLVLLAATAVVVPSGLALLSAGVGVRRLAQDGSQAVVGAADDLEGARELQADAELWIRHVRQARILEDDSLWDLARADRRSIATRVRTLSPRLPTATAVLDAVDAADAKGPRATADDDDPLNVVGRRAATLVQHAGAQVDASALQLRADAEEFWQRTLLQLGFAVPLVVLVLWVAQRWVVRPLRQVSDAIGLLGKGGFEHPIAISGPADLRRLGGRLEWLRTRLQQEESERMRLLEHVSHELKTPLTALREGSQLLAEQTLSREDEQKVAEILTLNADKLGQRIGDILRVSELARGELRLGDEALDLADLARAVLAQHHLVARTGAICFETDLQPARLRGDPHRVTLIIDNLITNALKVSPRDSRIRVQTWATAHEAVLVVQDDGPGFSPEERDRVFEPFFQGRAGVIGRVGGTGLGLTIAREYAKAHAGDLVIADVQAGARVEVHLPNATERPHAS